MRDFFCPTNPWDGQRTFFLHAKHFNTSFWRYLAAHVFYKLSVEKNLLSLTYTNLMFSLEKKWWFMDETFILNIDFCFFLALPSFLLFLRLQRFWDGRNRKAAWRNWGLERKSEWIRSFKSRVVVRLNRERFNHWKLMKISNGSWFKLNNCQSSL